MADTSSLGRTALVGFLAGALAVVAFHQIGFMGFTAAGVLKANTFSMAATKPFGVPAIFSAMFWGGLWGAVAAFVVPRLPGALSGPLGWVLFGGVVVTLVNWFVVLPIKGSPVGGGFRMPNVAVVPVVYAWWGLGMWLIATLLRRHVKALA